MPARIEFTAAQEDRLRGPESAAQLAVAFGISDMPIRRWRAKPANGYIKPAARAVGGPLGTPGVSTDGDGVTTLTSEALPLDGITDAESHLRTRWGFPVEKWLCISAVGNEWESGSQTLRQIKGSFRPVVDISALIPAPAAWAGKRYPRAAYREHAHAWQCVVVSDHQAPYIDDALHAATLAMIRDLRPLEIAHIGDLCDYTNISKHKDHAVVKADVDECTQSGVDILASIRDAAPDARFRILEGNHDIRPTSELLLRAERMAGIRVGDLRDGKGREELISLRRLWRLEELGIELVSDPRGWQHAELDIVPGENGLVAIHGHLTGDNVAAKSLASVGRSVIAGHTHRPEHVFAWNKTIKREQQAMVVGCQCETRGGGGKSFPTFVARDKWLQGPAIVTVHADGEFALQRARWNGESLFVGHDRWR